MIGDFIIGTGIGWAILATVAAMEALDGRRARKNDEGRGAHPGHPSVHHSAGVLAESPERA